jgi:hypothetical protein
VFCFTVPPPQDELVILHNLALMGDIRDIRERVAHLEQLDERFRPFASKQLAEAIETGAVLELIKPYMEHKQ